LFIEGASPRYINDSLLSQLTVRDPGSIRVLLSNLRWERRLLRCLELSGVGRMVGNGVDEKRSRRRGWIAGSSGSARRGWQRTKLSFSLSFPFVQGDSYPELRAQRIDEGGGFPPHIARRPRASRWLFFSFVIFLVTYISLWDERLVTRINQSIKPANCNCPLPLDSTLHNNSIVKNNTISNFKH